MTTRGIETAVVGAGIMGAAATWQLARRGRRVGLFEQFDLTHQRGSSHGYTRIFRVAYEDQDYVRLAEDAIPAWRDAEEALGVTLLRQPGCLDVGEREWVEPFIEGCERAGVQYEWLDRAQAMDRFQGYNLPEGFGVMYQPDGGWIYAETARTGFIRKAEEEGAEIHAETRVTRIEPKGDRVTLETSEGGVEVDQVVLTTAGWTNRLIEPLGLQVPMEITRQQVAFYPMRKRYDVVPSMWHIDRNTFLMFALPNGRDSLMKMGLHNIGPEVNPDSESVLDAARLNELSTLVDQRLPLLDANPRFSETCLYASTPDDDFVVDRMGPVILGFGFGSHGFKYGPLMGSFLADLVEGKEIPLAHRFSYARFQREPVSAG